MEFVSPTDRIASSPRRPAEGDRRIVGSRTPIIDCAGFGRGRAVVAEQASQGDRHSDTGTPGGLPFVKRITNFAMDRSALFAEMITQHCKRFVVSDRERKPDVGAESAAV